MWGGIFNMAVEGLGRYTSIASGLFMTMVCGGGILIPLQGYVADMLGSFRWSYVVVLGCALYILYYAVYGSKANEASGARKARKPRKAKKAKKARKARK
jgi:FHS family L-fucose permease-like MFS transporter